MRKLLLAGVAVAAVAAAGVTMPASAVAADLPYKAPVAVPLLAPNWTGFYLGAHLGSAWGTKEFFDPFDGKSIISYAVNGFLGGGQAGYNWQMGWVVLGIEGQFSWADVKGSSFGITTKVDWLGTVAGRIGGTVDHALLYVKGGVAWAHDKYSFFVDPGIAATGSETRRGWMLGAGVEYAFTRNWSGKVEYNYMDFGKRNVDICLTPGECDTFDIGQHIHLIKAGVNYKFDWGAPVGKGPMVARY